MNQECIKITKQSYPRHIEFESLFNFRDLGGYRAKGGCTLAWRRLFRSGYLHPMTERDSTRLKEEIKLTSVIELHTIPEIGEGRLSDLQPSYLQILYARKCLNCGK
jgi:hypothetical protein